MFQYWGRRGAVQQLTLEVARAALAEPEIATTISVSRQSELFDTFKELGSALVAFHTFSSNLGALSSSWRIPATRRRLYDELAERRIEAVIDLLPHVWSPFVTAVIKRAGALYVPIVHDATAHPGDRTGWVNWLIRRSTADADLVITLSEAVTKELLSAGRVKPRKLRTLFLPDLSYGPAQPGRDPEVAAPKRLLFLGRLMKYKGLSLLLDALEILRDQNVQVSLGVFGEGNIDEELPRLNLFGAEVVNRWLSSEEIADVLGRFDAVVLPYLEASQSGVAAAAFGAGLPVIATPVGGLTEQVTDGHNGVLAQSCSAAGLADAMRRLLLDREFYCRLRSNITADREDRSMRRFVRSCAEIVSSAQQNGVGRKRSGHLLEE
jgi:glycosyltransferase involved in cell wall biosynthesis